MNTITTNLTISTVHPGPLGGAIFTGQNQSGDWFRVIAKRDCLFRVPMRGEQWELTGQIIRHEKYGDQLHIAQARLLPPSSKLLVRYLTTHPAFRGIGIGQAKAAGLYQEFGEQLPTLLNEANEGELTKVLSTETAHKLVLAWQLNQQESGLIAFLNQHNVSVRLAGKILRYWPENTIGKLQENPYRLLIVGTWNIVDRIAISLGISATDDRRLIAAAEAGAYKFLDVNRDTKCDSTPLKRSIKILLRCADEQVSEEALAKAVSDGSLVGDETHGYQALGCRVMEEHLIERFQALLKVKVSQLSLFGNVSDQSFVDSCLAKFEQQEGFSLNAEQRAAVQMAAAAPLSVLTGGAGVGKTTVLKAIFQVIEAMNGGIVQMALAGRAAQRMREATGREAYTIIGFLNALRNNKIKLQRNQLIVIDEASMIDLMLMYRLVRALPEDVRFLFVGDPYQLPPIGPGLIFHVLARSQAIPVQELIQVHRQAESTGIPSIAKQIRNGNVPNMPAFNGLADGVSFVECESKAIIGHLVRIVDTLGGFGETQIIGVTKNGPSGINSINLTFHQQRTTGKPKLRGWDFAETDPILFTVNDYERELYNGSLGRIEKIYTAQEMATVSADPPPILRGNFDGREMDLTDEDLGKIELAYGITTHKAQGSQFTRVIIPVTKSRLLDRTLIYTALTRGVRQVVFVGDKRAFSQAVIDPPAASLRNVGFLL